MSYTAEEEDFLKYWEKARTDKHKILRRTGLATLPIALLIVIAILSNFFSGWYKRATMVANANPSLLIILLISSLLIVAFFIIFSSYHKWDVNENPISGAFVP
ncbi:MAG: hypothetical protein QM727_00460 [Niabella sp.]